MIGDWVLTLDSTHKEKVFTQVDAIEEGKHSILVTKECSNWFVDIDWIEPIPLTPEILEKNGFVLKPDGWLVWYKEGTEQDYIFIQFRRGCDEVRLVELNFVNNVLAKFRKIQFVHELQHILRLSGIKKEIEL